MEAVHNVLWKMRSKRATAAMKEAVSVWAKRIAMMLAVVSSTAALSYGVNCAYVYMTAPDTLPIQRLVVEGEFIHVSREDVRTAVRPFVQSGFFGSDLATVQAAVLGVPWVAWAAVQREWPDGLRLRVIERRAVARWADGGLVDERGVLFRPASASYPQALPLLRGPVGTQSTTLERYAQWSRQFSMVNLHVAELQLDERRAWTLIFDNGVHLFLGRNPESAHLQRFTQVYPRALVSKIDSISQIDLRYPNGFAVRWKDQAPDASTVERKG